jgi:hypothetical protein
VTDRTSGGTGPIDESTVPRRNQAVHTVELDGEAVLLDTSANRLHHLNRTASMLWACIDGGVSIGELAAEIAGELGLDEVTVRTDAVEVFQHLHREGLIDTVASRNQRHGDR